MHVVIAPYKLVLLSENDEIFLATFVAFFQLNRSYFSAQIKASRDALAVFTETHHSLENLPPAAAAAAST